MNERDLLTAAARIEREFPNVAALLRRTAVDSKQPRGLRRQLLRRIWRGHYPSLTRCAAAREIARAWRSNVPTELTPAPGTERELFMRLHAVCPRPLSERQIITDLDATFR